MSARLLLVLLLAGLWLPAQAGQPCEARKPTPAALARDLEFAARVALQLDRIASASRAEVFVLARAGQDLSRYGLRYSHLGLAYRDPLAFEGRGAWRVVHKLNACGSDRSSIDRQGLAEFFSDGLHRHVAGVAALDGLPPGSRGRLMDNATLVRLHEPRYNMVAYPWGGPYQQSNQWAIETLALLADPGVDSRRTARLWLRRQGYRADVIRIDALERLGARIGAAHISFDDHPLGQRLAGRIETVTVDSVLAWVARSGLGQQLPEIGAEPSLLMPRRQVASLHL